MRAELIRHPGFPCEAVASIEVAAERSASGVLTLRYRLEGVTGGLLVPPPAAPERTDELWKTTCFEAFVRSADGEGYYELNVAPSSAWAAYRFDGYRAGMRPARDVVRPGIALRRTGERLELEAGVDLGAADLPAEAPWRLGLSAVIQEVGGRTSYWALAHPAGRPDFHHAIGFARQLPVTERP